MRTSDEAHDPSARYAGTSPSYDDGEERYAYQRLGGVAGHDLISVSLSTVSPLGFSFASLRCGATVPSFSALAYQ